MQRGLNVGDSKTVEIESEDAYGQQLWNGTATTRSTTLERTGRHVGISVDDLEMLEQAEV